MDTDSGTLPLIDFHCHGGDVSRTDEIAAFIRSESLSALGLLSLPLAGFPGYTGTAAHLNGAVLETSKRLSGHFSSGDRQVRIFTFGSLDNRSLLSDGFEVGGVAAQVAALKDSGFDGLKLWEGKPEMAAALGLMPDSPWLAEACREAGRQDMPVIFHIADPPDFWAPEAGARTLTGRRIGNRDVPGFDDLIRASLRLSREAPGTTIIFPHLGFLAGNLERAGRFLNEAPNVMFDLAPGNYFFADLARNPAEARKFFSRWKDRIIFGSDSFFLPVSEGRDGDPGLPFAGDSLEGNRRRLRRLKTFLESSPDETVDNAYSPGRKQHPRIRCLGLSEEVLAPMFQGNAAAFFRSRDGFGNRC